MSEELIDVVFPWSLDDIFNEDLFKDQVEQIPDTFSSVGQYFGSFTFPLLEETRADLASKLDNIQGAPSAEADSIAESNSLGSLFYDIHVRSWRNRFREWGKASYRTLPGDILIISASKPETWFDLQRVGWNWAFASVTEIADGTKGSEGCSSRFKVKASTNIEVKEDGNSSFFVVFLTNVTTNRRIWNAMHMRKNLDVISRVISTEFEVEEDEQLCCVHNESQLIEKVGSHHLSELDESQKVAILNSLTRVKCHHKATVDLIWGPPGTGKTKTISLLLFSLLKMNCRTLVCTPTNIAVNDVALRVLRLVRKPFEAESENYALFCSLGDIVLLGNKDRLNLNSATKNIYIDYRADRLVECSGPLNGWRHCLTTMIEFLQDCVSQYGFYLENEMIGEKEHKDRVETRKVELLVEFASGRFKLAGPPLRRCLHILCTHVPKRLISEDNFRDMETLILYVGYLEMIFRDISLVPEELEKIFSCEVKTDDTSESSLDTKSLASLRSKCLIVSRRLQFSLNDLQLPCFKSKSDAMDFCFQNACLILCTASSSYMLHSAPINPMNVLIVDEAAQLRECESLIPLQLPGLRHAILVGDECQLPAMVCSNVSSGAGFGRSLFERLSLLGHPKRLLSIQYRMHPSINFFPNSKFYSCKISDAPLVKDVGYGKSYLPGPMFGAYSFINVIGGKEDVDDDIRHSRKNMVEVAIVVKIVRNLLKEYEAWNGKKELSIGVLSPYVAQVMAIQDKIGRDCKNIKGLTVKVKTIDGFQGGEADIIILSTVRSSAAKVIGFLSSPQRINVALTRARHCLWILGNEKTLAGSESIWQDLISDAKNRQSFFNADGDKDMAKAILQVKKDLNQLDDLLNEGSVLFRNAIWRVFFSDNFRKSFIKLNSSRKEKAVINLLLRLSNGWRPKNMDTGLSFENSSAILNQFKVEGLYIVCTIDIKKELGSYIQILKVWDLLPLEEVPRLMKRLNGMLAMCTDTYINCCKMKCLKGELEVPHSWVASTVIVQFKHNETSEVEKNEFRDGNSSSISGRVCIESSRVSESLLLMKFYWLSFGMVSHLLSDHEGEKVDLPFEVSDEQSEMILYPESTFILGRSGTGKTTILTMKLLRREEQHYIASKGISTEATEMICGSHTKCAMDTLENDHSIVETRRSSLRQLFVSVSPRLCDAVKRHVSGLKRFCQKANFSEPTDMDHIMPFENLPDTFLGIAPDIYPLILTFHKFLMMLDGSIGTSFFERFSALRESSHCKTTSSRSVTLEAFLRTKEVTYDRFCSAYWVHLNAQLKKQLDPSRVFTEIMSHIKGGLKEGKVCEGNLSREEYVLSKCKASTLTDRTREKIYDIFQDYEKAKAQRFEFDLADLVNDIHCRLRNAKFEGDEIHFVYIDEVQDLTMRQIALFKYICRNVDEGFSFAGDTAQTIARGIDFRFEDIRSLFYNEFLMESNVQRLDVSKGRRHMSELFRLKQNFRTHDGVLRLAQSVIDLLYCYFPKIIDALDPEESLIYGEEPVLLETSDGENAIVTIFGKRENENCIGNLVGFGAEQVVLVRDDCARKEISAYIGKKALVLTIPESKGLEFQDVLLYNFFGSSPLKSQWRVIYGYMEEHNMLDADNKSFPSFNQSRHNILCSELKQLYVAITRTRQRLWICENIEEFSKPMFDYWKKKSFARVKKLDEAFAQTMKVISSPEEWKARGRKLFDEGNYEMATMCFERAGDEIWEKWSKATSLKETAARRRGSNTEGARLILGKAAEIFLSIGKADSAAQCYYEWGEHEKAGRIYMEKCGEHELEKAAECFFLAGSFTLAAEVYAMGNYFSECLMVCTKAELFDVGLQYISCWKQLGHDNNFVTQSGEELGNIEQCFLESCAVHYYKLKDNRSMMKFVKVFHSIDSMRKFLKNLNCLDELMSVEIELGNISEAIKIAKLKGELLLEAELLKKAKHFKEAAMLMLWSVFANSLWAPKSKGWPLKHFSDAKVILAKASSLAKKVSTTFHEFISTDISILRNEECNLAQLYQNLNASWINKSLRGEVVSVWKILDTHLSLRVSKYQWDDKILQENLSDYFGDELSRNCVTIETLTYSWNLLKEKFENIFKYLIAFESQYANDCDGYGDFILNYFGVRRHVEDGVSVCYLLTNKDADWVRDIDDRFLQRNGNLVWINVLQFVSAARNHFRSEFLSIGLKLLKTLKALHKHATEYCVSVFCKSTPLIHIFEVSTYLLRSKDLDLKNHDVKTLRYFLDTTTTYFEVAFPLDCRKVIDDSTISLRRSDRSRHLLEDISLRKIRVKGDVTYGEIGRAVMILFSSGRPSKELYHVILDKFDNYRWKELVKAVGGRTYPDISQDSSSVKTTSLCRIFRASQDTYNAICRSYDYISPVSFLYLVDRLLLLSSFTRDFFLTMKSTLVEWIFSGDSCLNSISSHGAEDLSLTKDICEFLATMIEQLLCGKISMKEWAKRYELSMSYGCQMVLMRMVFTLCFVCLNCDTYFDILSRVLMKDDIMSLLPPELTSILRNIEVKNHLIMNAMILSKALTKFMDPLVIVSVRGKYHNIFCPNAIFVDMNATSCKDEALTILFPAEKKVPHGQDVDVEATKLCKDDGSRQFCEDVSALLTSISGQKITERKRCGKSHIFPTGMEKFPKGYPLASAEGKKKMKEWYRGLEAMDHDEWLRLSSAVDRSDSDEICSITWHTLRKQYFLTGDPKIGALLKECHEEQKEGYDFLMTKINERRRKCGSTSASSNNVKDENGNENVDSGNMDKGKERQKKVKNEKGARKK